jgi:hypothetical protein
MKSYIEYNTEERRKAKESKLKFEIKQFKDLNVTVYGKTMEDNRKHISIDLYTDEENVRQISSKPEFKDYTIFNENLICVMKHQTKTFLNKPIYTGACILDLSKLHMYQTFYEVFKPLWGDRVKIITYDTDSFFLEIYTEDVYDDLKLIKEHMDLSLYPEDFKLHDKTNLGKLGTFKDELAEFGGMMTEICALRSKAYAYKAIDIKTGEELKCEKKLKGIGKITIDKYVAFSDFENSIIEPYTKINYKKMFTLNSIHHEMFVNEINKKAISPYDDKRYILSDGIKTLPHTDDATSVLLELLGIIEDEEFYLF